MTEDKLSKYINYEDFVRSEISKFIEDRVKKHLRDSLDTISFLLKKISKKLALIYWQVLNIIVLCS